MSDTPLLKTGYYDEFKCLMGKCPDNCCHGWGIPLDEEALERFKKEKGLWGMWIRSTIHGKEQKVFSPMSVRCPHLCRDGLCGLQKKRGESFIADVCREYPKVRMNYGPVAEYHLDLSCVHAASLFLRHRDDEELLIRSSAEDLPETYGNNDDIEYFTTLYSHRQTIIDTINAASLMGAKELDDALRRIAGREWAIQKELLTLGNSDKWDDDDVYDTGQELFLLPIEDVNEMMSTCFFEEWLQYSGKYLYKLCKLYYKCFDKLNYRQGDELWHDMSERYIYNDPHIVKLAGDYMISLILRRYLISYEDYSPYHHFKDAYLSLNLFLLFYMLSYEKNGKPKKREIAHIISVVEKRFFHNDYALKDIHAAVKTEKNFS